VVSDTYICSAIDFRAVIDHGPDRQKFVLDLKQQSQDWNGGRGFYYKDHDGHVIELMTMPQ
jgi:hypothetical protein